VNEHEKAGGDDEHIEKVRRRAHAIWLDEGMGHGRDQEHWHQAEQEITAEEAAAASPKADEPAPQPPMAKGASESSAKGGVTQFAEAIPAKPVSAG
jgi:Protein of unknown function (DUF2934)